MAFLRWRGRCAQLLATVYKDGHSKQISLATFPEFHISDQIRDMVEKKHPTIPVDWNKIRRDFAKGPPDHLVEPASDEHQEMALAEIRLRKWSRDVTDRKDAGILWDAAIVLLNIRVRHYFENEVSRIQR